MKRDLVPADRCCRQVENVALSATNPTGCNLASGVAIPGGWVEEPVRLGQRHFNIKRPHDPDALLEELAQREALQPDEPDPYWARLWPCAVTMAEAVLQADWLAVGETLEIGCGIGLVGLAALSCGLTVTFSDHVPIAVSLAVENAQRNGFLAQGLLLDWDHPVAQQFGVILGSDVIYDRRSHDRLLTLVEQMLASGGVCWLGDPGRADSCRFVERAIHRGFRVQIQDETGSEMPFVRTGHYRSLLLRR